MATLREPQTPSHHLPLEPTGLTPGLGGTPGFFSAEFGALNPFDVDFNDATASPTRIEQPAGTPPPHYSYLHSEIPRSAAETALRRNYDPSLVPTPGPRLPGLAAFKSSALKETSTISRLPPSPRRSPQAMNPAFLVDKQLENDQFALPLPVNSSYSSSRAAHGQVTPPTDESRSPEDKEAKPNKKAKPSRKRKASEELKSEKDNWSDDDDMDDPNLPQDQKRKKFLERNRLAASKCRQKKKEWANNLEEQARYQAQENKILRASCAQLRDECLYLKNFLLSTHSGCQCVGVKNYLMKEAQLSQQVGMGGVMPIANLIHSGMEVRYPMMMDERPRSMSVASGNTMSDGRPHQGSMSP